ncbi:FUSC family protein [Rhizobium sp. BR 362]|uniref:FUSC family protein n=1 Tax=Rhizobium sp. BR 362 TaxID=3040670 RepID=UPI002F42268A
MPKPANEHALIFIFGGIMLSSIARRLEKVDPGSHRRIKGIRLVTAFGLAALAGAHYASAYSVPKGNALGVLAAGFALWGSVSEARSARLESTRDLLFLAMAAVAGAIVTAAIVPVVNFWVPAVSEIVLVLGAFLVGYLRRLGTTGAGIGSQFFIGQLLAYGAGLTENDIGLILISGAIAAVASIIPRVLSGPSEHPTAPMPVPVVLPGRISPELAMGLQGATAALAIVILSAILGLEESIWAVTAGAYVVAGSMSGTMDRVRRRIIGTAVGVPIGLAMLPAAIDYPLVVWMAAGLAMVVYAMALPERYDIACGAYAYALVVTLAATGEHSYTLLAARLWETALGGMVGLLAAAIVFPLRTTKADLRYRI